MSLQNFFLIHLDRLPLLGTASIFATLSLTLFLLPAPSLSSLHSASPVLPKVVGRLVDFDLPLKEEGASICLGECQNEIGFSIDPPRVSIDSGSSRLMVRLAQSREIKRIEPHGRVYLEYDPSGVLQFSADPSFFWLEVALRDGGAFEATLAFKNPDTEEIRKSSWELIPQETPIQSADEFKMDSPFRLLGTSKWLGQDLFSETYGEGQSVQRLEMSAPNQEIELQLGQWLVFRKGNWERVDSIENTIEEPIVRIRKVGPRGLEFEGWDGQDHVRLALPLFASTALKARGEELFSQLRVRSEKQISCTMDKQCLILRPGDWVIKLDQRWKILRRKEEKEAFSVGLIKGDLFVLDRIEAKGASKSISGHYFGANRAQMAKIDYAMPISRASGSKSPDGALGKSRGRGR